MDVEQDEDRAGHPDGQTEDIYDRVDLVAEEVSEGDQEVALGHGRPQMTAWLTTLPDPCRGFEREVSDPPSPEATAWRASDQ